MDNSGYNESSSVSYLNCNEGIQFDGRSYALFDPNFKIYEAFSINFQLRTFAHDGLILWIDDPLPESSFTIEIQNRQLIARAVVDGQPFSVRTDFTKNRLCDGVWHCVQVRLEGSLLSMKVDMRQYCKTEPRAHSIDMRGPLFIAGYSEKYSPTYLSVRSNDFFQGHLRNLKINEKQIEWLAPRLTAAARQFYHISSQIISTNAEQSFLNAPAFNKSFIETA
ncbi:unnamed protein product [Rotaria socialis]|uniref:Laminin G domain-containing protein n=1 Tax=Rotaria socialis TaxID=392032 RepID=A0A820ZSX3_9BILA|nr:unnamed protein product [Rotaria socialis]CAF3387906.1 unnamed protein product [Rotaria socialis]CAF3393643.1 unnamed protein product [Rotaria socialis]CAF3456656.1 unnamed protein product [Rotaria socialis]CAF3523453.1 unnamed protein product [Rotaria socialis]